MAKVGRKAMEREEKRKNGICVPLMAAEKQKIQAEAERIGVSAAGFLRMLASAYFEMNEKK
jgi:hypothetical protein